MQVIPNEESWIAFSPTVPANLAAPSIATDLGAVGTLDVTDLVVSLTANATGNAVPTPRLKSLFETSVPGTSTATFTGDFYRDDVDDAAWDALPRGTVGVFYISRFGGTGPEHRPAVGEPVEVWPIQVISRSAGPLTSNTAQTFTLTASVPAEPEEDAVVAA